MGPIVITGAMTTYRTYILPATTASAVVTPTILNWNLELDGFG